MALTKVSTPGIKDGTILNEDVNASADIAGSKLADNSISLAKLVHGDSNNNGKFLRANNGADPSFETIDLTALSASNLTSGTIPDARFPSVLPAIDGSNLTGITSTTINNNADNRVITGGSGTTLNAESLVTVDSNGRMAIGLSVGGVCLTASSAGSTYGGALRLINTVSSNHEWTIAVGGGDNAYVAGRGLLFRDETTGINHSQLQTNGNIRIVDGDLQVASGHGIDFSPNANATGAQSEVLDDYEEGTWTVSNGNFTVFNVTSSQITARYTKIGDQVTVWINQTGGQIAWSQPQYIQGLPFTVSVPSAGSFTNNYPNAGGEALIWSGERIYMAQSDGYNTNDYKMVFCATYRTTA